ncbi:hypothetical protein CPB86DRAFT_810497 [Serendipita vermifera]|nr:hypothetical protein CPB86DRAFT_810497 [Serendipita vermifera]
MSSGSTGQTSPQTEELPAERWSLRGEITRLINSNIDSKKKEILLKTKKVAYNQVMDRLQPYRRGVNPMDRFPVEILEIIILDCITYWHSFEQYLEKQVELLLPLTMVSRQWRNYIHSAPILWDCISTRGNRGDTIAHVVRGLKLSGDRPLTVILEVWPSLWTKIRPHFLNHRDRIVAVVSIRGGTKPNQEQDSKLYGIEMICELAPLPNLRVVRGDLGYGNRKDSVKEIFNQSRSLECFEGFSLDSKLLLEAQGNVALQEFRTHQELPSLLPLLERMPSIRKISMFTYTLQTSDLTQEPRSLSSDSAKPFNWKYLHFTQNHPLASLFHRLPFLTCLNVMLRTDQIEEVALSLHKLQSLGEFKLYITSSRKKSTSLVESAPTVNPNHTIRYLEIDAVSLRSMPNVSKEEKEMITIHLSELLSQAAPAVENMQLWADSAALSRWKLNTNDALKKLTIRPAERRMDIYIPNSVETLFISTSTQIEKPMPASNIKTLDIEVFTLYSVDRIHPQEDFIDLKEWPELKENHPQIASLY